MAAAAPEQAGRTHDLIFAFFGVSWGAAMARGTFTEDRFANALLDQPRVRRLLVAEPFRSHVGRARARLGPWREVPFPALPDRALFAPSRWRRSDPPDPRRTTAAYEARLRRRADALGMDRPAVISCHPFLAGFGDFAWAGPVTYYGWDDWLASEPHREWWPAYADAFATIRATHRRVCGVTPAVVERVAPTGRSIVVPNGLLPSEWRAIGPAPSWFAALPRPRFVYAGSLDARIDVGQLAAVAAAFPEGSVAIVGPMLDAPHFDALRTTRNITIRPPEGREAIAGLIAAADACLIPHVSNEMTHAMSPLKLYEYLAAGRPVAATALPPIVTAASAGHVALAPPEGDFAAAARRALELGPSPEPERHAFIEANSWERRFETVLDFALAPDAAAAQG